MAGKLIALEGIDGSGKSTQARLLAESIGADLTFEPGATGLGRVIRQSLLHSSSKEISISIEAEALLMIADRAQDIAENIAPAIYAGKNIVTDRFSGSTIAYQGYGRGIDIDTLQDAIRLATGSIEPALNVLLDIPVDQAMRRIAGTGNQTDRMERLGIDFLDRVRQGYLSMASADPDNWYVLDCDRPIEEIAEMILSRVRDLL
ncbi:MAG: dTMP kinase [Actinobacteria bacterium]|jgi:dTMP kinase|nr:dTMP kinase [Actinomycetota bacterium]MCL5885960.1 dTMP kinase [Actinomycetota bacterium]